MEQFIVDAFAEKLFEGNPAAVLPCKAMPSPEMMLKIAIENNYSETAFVVGKESGRYDLKWFTPGGEVDLCGHATLATAFTLFTFYDTDKDELRFDTLSGELAVRREEDAFTMDFPIGKVKPVPVCDRILAATAGLAKEAYYDGGDTVVIVESEEKLAEFVPDADLIRKIDGLGLILTASSNNYDFVSRCFYPDVDVPEDPVTGRAHTFMAPIWASKLGKTTMMARQISKRGGTLKVRLGKDRVYITGKARLFMRGEIPFDF